MSCMPKEFYTKEMKQALYNEWVDTYYNSNGRQAAFLLSLSSLSLVLVILFCTLACKLEEYLSASIIGIIILGLALYIPKNFPSTFQYQKRKKERLKEIEEDIALCNENLKKIQK